MKDCRGADKGAIFLAAICLHRASPQHHPVLKPTNHLSHIPLFFHRGGGSGWQNVTAVAEISNHTPTHESWNFCHVWKSIFFPNSVPFSLFPCEGSCAAAFVVTPKDNKQIEGVSGEEKRGGEQLWCKSVSISSFLCWGSGERGEKQKNNINNI